MIRGNCRWSSLGEFTRTSIPSLCSSFFCLEFFVVICLKRKRQIRRAVAVVSSKDTLTSRLNFSSLFLPTSSHLNSIDPSLLSEPLPSLNPSDEDESVDQTESLTLDKALQTGVGEKGIELKELVVSLEEKIVSRSGRSKQRITRRNTNSVGCFIFWSIFHSCSFDYTLFVNPF